MEDNNNQQNKDYRVIRWISFIVVTVLFIVSATKAIVDGGGVDKILAAIFIVIAGTAWGANLWKTLIR